MTTPNDNTYISITLPNVPRAKANDILQHVEELAEGYDISVDWGSPIGSDDPTPIADEAADAVDPTTPSVPVSDPPAVSDQADAEPPLPGNALPPVDTTQNGPAA